MNVSIKEAKDRVFIYKDVKCINIGYISSNTCLITPIDINIGKNDIYIGGKFWNMISHPDPAVRKVMDSQPLEERSHFYYAAIDVTPVILAEELRDEKYLFPPINLL